MGSLIVCWVPSRCAVGSLNVLWVSLICAMDSLDWWWVPWRFKVGSMIGGGVFLNVQLWVSLICGGFSRLCCRFPKCVVGPLELCYGFL